MPSRLRDRPFRERGEIGHDRPKWLVTMGRNHRSRSAGIGGHDGPKYPIAAWRSVSKHYRDLRVVSVALDRVRLKYEQAGRDAVDEMVAIKMPSLDVIVLVHADTEHVQRD